MEYRKISLKTRVFIIVLIFILVIPVSLFAEQKIQYYQYNIINDSVYEEIFIFYGKFYNDVDEYLSDYDSVFVNIVKIEKPQNHQYYTDSIYQINKFGSIIDSQTLLSLRIHEQQLSNSNNGDDFWGKRASLKIPRAFNYVDKTIFIISLLSTVGTIVTPFFLSNDNYRALQVGLSFMIISSIFFIPSLILQYLSSYINDIIISLFR